MFKGSPKTSIAGIAAIIAVVAACVKAQFDGDPVTVPDWGAAVAVVLASFGLFAARDNGTTSEDVKKAGG